VVQSPIEFKNLISAGFAAGKPDNCDKLCAESE